MPQTDQNYIEVNTALVFGVVFYFPTVGQSLTGSARAWGRDGGREGVGHNNRSLDDVALCRRVCRRPRGGCQFQLRTLPIIRYARQFSDADSPKIPDYRVISSVIAKR